MNKTFLGATALAVLFALPGAALAQGREQRDPGELLLRADSNGDGQITTAEYRSTKARLFDRLDRNKDGVVNSSDTSGRRLMRRGGGERMKQLIEFMDGDGDGRVERAEFVDGPSALFDFADTDGNQVIDRRELEEFRERAAERRAR